MSRAPRVAVATMLLLLAACGRGTADAPTADVFVAAAEATLDAGSSRFAMTISVDAGGFALEFGGEGVGSLTENRGQMTMTVLGGEIETIYVDDDVYMRGPLIAMMGADAETWVHMDTAAVSGGVGSSAGQLDPTQSLAFLEAASDELDVVGTEDVRDTPTTHYRFLLDPSKLDDANPAAEVPPEVLAQLEGLDAIPGEAWIGDDGLLRKMRITVDLAQASQQAGMAIEGEMVMDFEMYDFGVAVDVQAPPADQVVEASSIPGFGEGGAGGSFG